MSQLTMSFAIEDLGGWLGQKLLPFWAATGFDSQTGAFIEKLDLSAQPSSEDYTRVRLQARQIYVYAQAHTLQLFPDGLALARGAYAFLLEHAWDHDGEGWFHRLRRDGTPLDRTKDCYDHAFMLLAMAWLYRAGGDPEVLQRAKRTIAFVDSSLGLERDGSFDGYTDHAVAEGEAIPLPRRQNPHMHLFEALLALYEASGEQEWFDRAGRILDLFKLRFYAADTGQLTEFFDSDWNEMAVEGALLREPGHHFEWVWLLHRYGQLSGDDSVLPIMEKLFSWGWQHGIDRRPGGVFGAYDELDQTGRVLKGGSKRLWPQTEALKACLALTERCGDPTAKAGSEPLLKSMFTHFVSFDHALWQDQLDGDGKMIAPAIPASSLYHLFLALAEVLRVLPDSAQS
ncbi:hypothetical protein HBA54_24600 [Pelagibius litoralis]|uniref:Mannose-6-phosphate isomerase n=1 Tax=Pelagibius litoralis TaxID=374515 RepID=A0A967F2B0_9PROT|nr:AGE family epimerase/isomerase [Pelagibius litoralis]NIA71780.1 hypothetical protein [Pelagibius litoralis]